MVTGLVLVAAICARSRAEDGAAVFKQRCARCHGETGDSDTAPARALKVAPLVNSARLAGMTPGEIAQAVRTSPKHGTIADVADADVEVAAAFVLDLAKRGAPGQKP